MRFRFIETHRQEFRLDVMCRVLDVTKSGSFTWQRRPTSTRELQDTVLTTEIGQLHATSNGRYGVPSVHAALREQGQPCSRRRVARLMAAAGLKGNDRKKYKCTTNSGHAHPIADDLVQRHVEVEQPDTVWAADLSLLPTREGWLYLSIILDLPSRLVVGWAMRDRLTTDLPLAALQM
uniref:IS3 family transposase n=1 Tax=Deinococcus ruber TaxID=1848197 RepID=UPI001E3CE876